MSEEGLDKYGELIGSILVDIMGMLSYVVPGIGEASDIATAPLTMGWIYEMLNDAEALKEDSLVVEGFTAFGGVEELAPFIDIIPSASIAWFYKWRYLK